MANFDGGWRHPGMDGCASHTPWQRHAPMAPCSLPWLGPFPNRPSSLAPPLVASHLRPRPLSQSLTCRCRRHARGSPRSLLASPAAAEGRVYYSYQRLEDPGRRGGDPGDEDGWLSTQEGVRLFKDFIINYEIVENKDQAKQYYYRCVRRWAGEGRGRGVRVEPGFGAVGANVGDVGVAG